MDQRNSGRFFLKTFVLAVFLVSLTSAGLDVFFLGFDRAVPVLFIVHLLPGIIAYLISKSDKEKLIFWASNFIFAVALIFGVIDLVKLSGAIYAVPRIALLASLGVMIFFIFQPRLLPAIFRWFAAIIFVFLCPTTLILDRMQLQKPPSAQCCDVEVSDRDYSVVKFEGNDPGLGIPREDLINICTQDWLRRNSEFSTPLSDRQADYLCRCAHKTLADVEAKGEQYGLQRIEAVYMACQKLSYKNVSR